MHQKLELTNNITIDFLIPVAEKGGVENCVNMISRFLADKGVNIRVIQIVYEGAEWLDESIAFFPLMDNSKSHSVQEYIPPAAQTPLRSDESAGS